MYRIHFEPNGGYFCIQILKYNLLWVAMTDGKSVKRFTTHSDAVSHVDQIGLSTLYQDSSADKFAKYLAAPR